MSTGTFMSSKSNIWLSAMMAMVVIGLIGRGFYTLHYNGEDYTQARVTAT